MTQRHKIQLFEDKKVRTAWDDEREEWYFSIVDVCGVLTESKDPQAYWRKLKQRLKDEGNETVTNCHALKMRAADGKMRMTDVADTEQMFRIIQSIPSKKAEPSVSRDRYCFIKYISLKLSLIFFLTVNSLADWNYFCTFAA